MAGDVRRFEEIIDQISKSFQSLMVAHGAGLITCLSVLKDYATTPAYKGVGIPIAAFTAGFILSLAGFMTMLGIRMETATAIMSGNKPTSKWPVPFATITGGVSAFLLISALIVIAQKLFWM